MRIMIEPGLCAWGEMVGEGVVADDDVVGCINANAERLGTGRVNEGEGIVATGHQAWFWHAGILVKDIAGAVWAEKHGKKLVHLVVDHDVNEALRLQVPVEKDGRLYVQTVRLGREQVGIATGFQGCVEVDEVLKKVDELNEPARGALRDAWEQVKKVECKTLAEQVGVAQVKLMEAYTGGAGRIALIFSSDLTKLRSYQRLVDVMMGDAERCVQIYNEEVRKRAEAGVGELVVTREVVELPLWAVKDGQRRRRVFADIGDSRTTLLVDEAGNVLGGDWTLAPKALLLTAAMRSDVVGCELFIHGTGGGVYDKITECWWKRWRGCELCPMVVATADMYLDFDVPNCGLDELQAAVWWAHHVVHNVDRVDGVVNDGDGMLVEEKISLLGHMNDDRDRRRRRAAFRRIHEINDSLVDRHHDLVEAAEKRLADAKAGVKNRELAKRRDWSFVLYSKGDLMKLREMVEGGCSKNDRLAAEKCKDENVVG
ncbi:hypothetical protein JD969_15005 [Planctomycetota bacterium]|nr:hypothetical protein JD969_15005 [Planctomycetota bacterium]